MKHPDAPDIVGRQGSKLELAAPPCRRPSSISSATARPTGTSRGRLQGQHDIPLNALGRAQARACGEILRDLLARDGRDPADFDYVSSPLGRARETMELMRAALGLARRPLSHRRAADGNVLRPLGGLHHARNCRRASRALAAARARQMGFRAARAARATRCSSARVRAWYDGLERDTVVVRAMAASRAA